MDIAQAPRADFSTPSLADSEAVYGALRDTVLTCKILFHLTVEQPVENRVHIAIPQLRRMLALAVAVSIFTHTIGDVLCP